MYCTATCDVKKKHKIIFIIEIEKKNWQVNQLAQNSVTKFN